MSIWYECSFQLWSQLWKGCTTVGLGNNIHFIAREIGIVELLAVLFFFFFSPCNTYGFFGCCCFVCLLVCCCCSLLSTPCHTALTRKSNSDPAPYSPTQPPTEKLSRSTIGRNLFWQFFVRPYVVQIVTKLVLELTCIFIFWRRWLVPPCVGLFKLMCSELFSWTPTQVLQ